MAQGIVELNDDNFAAEIRAGITLVDFWAPWCVPCHAQAKILEQVAERVGSKAKMAKLNVDEGRQVAESLGIRAIPTLILFKNGRAVQQMVGVQMQDALLKALDGAEE